MSQTTGPILIFQDQAEAATAFNVSRFPDSDILDIARDGPGRLDAAVRSRLQTWPDIAHPLYIFTI